MKPLDSGKDWTFEEIEDTYLRVKEIVDEKYQLNYYPNQIEIISSEQMLDAYCITPDHKLLRRDLRWIEADHINVGDVVLGFDENGPHRKYKAAHVTHKEYDEKEVFEVGLSSGKVFRVTGNHLWLTRRNKGKACVLVWKSTQELRSVDNSHGLQPTYIPKLMDIWEEDTSKEADWLAETYNNKGNIFREGLCKLSIFQNEGSTLNKITQIISQKGYSYSTKYKPSTKSCINVDILGDIATRLRFLGEMRPERLIEKLDFDKLNTLYTSRQKQEHVTFVRSIGVRKIVKITTSTNTFVCDGYPMHNSAHGMPIFYNHWSFGRRFSQEKEAYRRGRMGLAYEIVINSNPCISYLMEENTMAMQTLVIAHAAFGHNHFFKNNSTFKQWSDAEAIIDYLNFAKHYINECEEKYGYQEVETVLDIAHALSLHGIDRYKRPPKMSKQKLERLQKEKLEQERLQYDHIMDTVAPLESKVYVDNHDTFPNIPAEPEENILYFLEKHSANLDPWKREVLRIVRRITQYFYPQMLTQTMNEGFATFIHYNVLNDMYDRGYTTDGFMLEFLKSHTSVILQPKYSTRINPYALGFAVMQDIKRVCMDPTKEDIDWFRGADFVGSGDWLKMIKFAVENFRDESFILQYLSPKVMRDFQFMSLLDDDNNPYYYVEAIQDDAGYKTIRKHLSETLNINNSLPNIQIVKANMRSDRKLTLVHSTSSKTRYVLDKKRAIQTLTYLTYLWGYDVELITLDEDGNEIDDMSAMFIDGVVKTTP